MSSYRCQMYVRWLCLILCVSCVTPARVVELSERFLEIKDREVWLVKFYAPWCGHCKTLEPIWGQVAQKLVDTPIRVSRLDCTKYTSIAQQFRVAGFPTIMFISKDKQVEYRGDRTVADILDFAKRVYGDTVRQVDNCDDMKKYLEGQPAVFVLAKGKTASGDDSELIDELIANFTSHAKHMHSHNYFLQVPLSCVDGSQSTTGVYVYKDKQFHRFKTMEDESLERWILRERFPSFQRINHANFNHLLGSGKYLVTAVLEENQIGKLETLKMGEMRDMLEAIAVNTRHLYHDKFLFGWFPSTDIPFSVAMAELDLPSILVIDPETYRYYLPDDSFDSQSILKLLDEILSGTPASYGGNTLFYRIYRSYFEMKQNIRNMYKSSPVLTVIIFLVPMGFFAAILYLTCCADIMDASDEDDDEAENHEKND